MSFARSLRAKVLLSAFIPGTIVLVAVAVIALFTYQRTARNDIQQRDTELAKITAARLSESLTLQRRVLQDLAGRSAVHTMEADQLSRALEEVQSQLFVFDGGVVFYDNLGTAVWSDPFSFERRRLDFPVPSELERVASTLRPRFSDVFEDVHTGGHAVLLAVPIVASGGELRGVLAGISSLSSLASLGEYSDVLEITAGSEGFAYLVDGNGTVIYHRDNSELGTSRALTEPVARAIAGETGALLSEDPTGESVISGFTPLPESEVSIDWAVITQERWRDVVGPIRDRSMLLLGLLVAGGLLMGGITFFMIGRVLKPVKELTLGARRIAGGDFDHTISTQTSDEIQQLSEQFNTMAGALKESYSDLERRVVKRTEELRESEERYRALFEDSRYAIFMSAGDGNVVDVNEAALDLFGFTREEAIGSDIGDRFVGPGDRDSFRADIGRTGSVKDFEVRLRTKDGAEVDCLLTASRQLDAEGNSLGVRGIIHDITERKQAEQTMRELAVVEERNRMAREIHDTLAQGFTGIVLQLEAAEQVLDGDHTEIEDHLYRAKTLARDSLQEARRSVWDLLPKPLEEHSLDDAIQQAVDGWADQGHERASFILLGDERELPPEVQTALLRICQESLANIRRHASATEVKVELTSHPDDACLEIYDNGQGFNLEEVKARRGPGGFGLAGMEQRAHILGGTLSVQSQRGKGTLVEARIPLP